ncbi:uncharacterized protein LOC107370634 [Tetranychus urticae]|uniref:Gustatory receptor n=1 Tax=Tetranychus urticae TaxID=32264 RepID=T1KG95_TETUR|nr:uncharacterized protein LOC107370634 [Tetranychus urticae]
MEEAIEAQPTQRDLVKRFKYLIGLPDEVDADEYAGKAITIMEKCARSLLITRRGYHQSRRDYQFEDYTWKNSLGRAILIFVGLRITIIAIVPADNQLVTVFLGNPFHGKSYSQEVALLTLLLLTVLSILREVAIYIEDAGYIMDLQFLRIIQIYGFDHKLLFLTPKQCKAMKPVLIFHVVNWTRMLRFNKFANGVIMLSFRLVDPLFYSNPVYFITSVFWIIMETIAARMSFTALLNVGGHTIVMVPWYIFRLRSVHEMVVKVNSMDRISESRLKHLTRSLLFYLNCYDKIMKDCRYLFFYCIFFVSFLADTVIFMAIVSSYPSHIIGTFYFAGFFCITAIGSVIYFAGEFVDRPNIIHGLLTKIIHKCQDGYEEKLNMHKVLDRIAIYGTGARIGDVINKIERDLFVFYILENASTVMLLICNIRTA